MKHSIVYLFISFLIFGCSKKEDDSSKDIVEAVPLSVTELIGQSPSNTQISLKWKDNSANETGFKIERKIGNESFTQVAIVGSNVTSYEDKGLAVNTIYSYKVLAYNTGGNAISYSNVAEVTVYPSVIIGSLSWMQRNLDVDHYRNGDPIPQVTDPAVWANLKTGAWCYYENNTANGTIYGKLYNWYAVNDPRGFAPLGWHVASDAEWDKLHDISGGAGGAGIALKSTEHWMSPNSGATNSTGFTAFPGGARLSDGTFDHLEKRGYWWTADKTLDDLSFYSVLYYHSIRAESGYQFNNSYGLSVRCVRD